jgi:hypothetical protein
VAYYKLFKSFGHGTAVNKCRGLWQYLAKAQDAAPEGLFSFSAVGKQGARALKIIYNKNMS